MQAIGEVLTAEITGFVAEAWKTESSSGGMTAPQFGSFLKARSQERDLNIYAVVNNIITGPQDQMHKPAALRMTRAELEREQPQIFELLKTEWHLSIVAWKNSAGLRCGLPPYPPEVHDFVYPLEAEETVELSEDLEFLRMLAGTLQGISGDELLAAVIRNAARARHEEYQYLVKAGQEVSRIFRDDYERLGSVLKRIRPGQ